MNTHGQLHVICISGSRANLLIHAFLNFYLEIANLGIYIPLLITVTSIWCKSYAWETG